MTKLFSQNLPAQEIASWWVSSLLIGYIPTIGNKISAVS